MRAPFLIGFSVAQDVFHVHAIYLSQYLRELLRCLNGIETLYKEDANVNRMLIRRYLLICLHQTFTPNGQPIHDKSHGEL